MNKRFFNVLIDLKLSLNLIYKIIKIINLIKVINQPQ